MKKKWPSKFASMNYCILILSVIFVNLSYANDPGQDIIIGKKVTIESKVLDETRTMMVYLPPGYEISDRKYPVLYLLDGRAHFLHASGITHYLARLGNTPPMIVVAIANIDRTRDFSPTHRDERPNTGGAPAFLGFLDKELIPFIDQSYKTVPFRILMGHSFGGTFATYCLYTKPDLFNAYISISPYLQWDENLLVNQAKKKLKSSYTKPKFYFMTVGNEPDYFEPLKQFSSVMKMKSENAIDFQYVIMKDEDHSSIPHISIYKGLKFIFNDWQLPQYKMREGLSSVDAHYEQVSQQYGYTINTPEITVNYIGYTHLGNNEIDKAIEVFVENVKRYPKSANVYDSLGEAYERNNQLGLASQNYQKAYDLGIKLSDPNVFVYKQNLERVKKK